MKKIILATCITMILFSCSEKGDTTKSENEKYSKIGFDIVKASTSALNENLMNAIKRGGVSHAIEFCNTNAYKITDSLSKKYNAVIRRSSLKIRNPKNAPDQYESDVLKIYSESYKKKELLKPLIRKINDSTFMFFAPITIKHPICLNCHGDTEKYMEKELYGDIKSLYPDDKAIAYKLGDFRGIWSVKMKKDSD